MQLLGPAVFIDIISAALLSLPDFCTVFSLLQDTTFRGDLRLAVRPASRQLFQSSARSAEAGHGLMATHAAGQTLWGSSTVVSNLIENVQHGINRYSWENMHAHGIGLLEHTEHNAEHVWLID